MGKQCENCLLQNPLIMLPLNYPNCRKKKLFWHTLFPHYYLGSTSEFIEFTLFVPFNFAFL